MKILLPNIKIGSAGLGFILSCIILILLGIFLFTAADQTRQEREKRTPTAEVIINPTAYVDDLPNDNNTIEEIERDLPPSIEDLSDTIEVSPVETYKPLFSQEDEITILHEKDKEVEEEEIADESSKPTFSVNTSPPRIALIISDMGLSKSATEAALKTLPKPITLAFAPYANNLDKWTEQAKRSGREFLISIPMEPETFPHDDPGPNALLTSLPDEYNIQRLDSALSKTSGYVGIINFMGSRFTANQEKLGAIIQHLKGKNILVVDSGSGRDSLIASLSRVNDVPYAKNDRFIDNQTTAKAINEQLAALENIARTRGQAIGVGFPYPITFESIINWEKGLQAKGIVLVPISDLSSDRANNQ